MRVKINYQKETGGKQTKKTKTKTKKTSYKTHKHVKAKQYITEQPMNH